MGSIDIKDNVSITAETYIFSTSHAVNSRLFESVHSQVVIEDHAWIGARAMILPGVTIGKGAVLAAASTASRSIPDFMIAAGCPAREVGRRSSEIDYTLDYSPFFQ